MNARDSIRKETKELLEKHRQYEYRMSKKVSELTQVVHMLFVRNHEKEIELEALKIAYEEEIDHVIKDAKDKLEEKDKLLKTKNDNQRDELTKTIHKLEKEFKDKEKETEQKKKAFEDKLAEEKKSNQKLRDCISLVQKEAESARTTLHNEKLLWQAEANQIAESMKDLQGKCNQQEKRIHELEKTNAHIKSEMETKTQRLMEECQRSQAMTEHNERIRHELSKKNNELEQEVRNLKREWRKINAELEDMKQIKLIPHPPASKTNSNVLRDHQEAAEMVSEEVEQLRRELLRYKMELLNRDATYNKIFKENNSFLVDGKAGLIASISNNGLSQNQSQQGSTQQSKFPKPVMREKSFSYVIGQTYDSTATDVVKFPQMHNNQNQGISLLETSKSTPKLSKPKPPKHGISVTN